jgi:hypothetical protein
MAGAHPLIEALVEARIEFVLVGGTAAVLHGAPIVTHDVDIVHRQTDDNLDRLVAFLDAHDAHIRDDARRLRPSRDAFAGSGHVLLSTDLGPLDVLCRLGPGQNYDWLLDRSFDVRLGSRDLRVIDLPTLIEVKTATGRMKDKLVLPILIATLEERRKGR